jgi:hypothetical protein
MVWGLHRRNPLVVQRVIGTAPESMNMRAISMNLAGTKRKSEAVGRDLEAKREGMPTGERIAK